MPDCLFCTIASGAIPSARVHDDDRLFAFLDINPLARGHTLVIPKRHAAKLEDLDAETSKGLLPAVSRITRAVCQAMDAPDATIAINNGPAAGQEVPHLHVHIIPRTPGDAGGPIHALFRRRASVARDELAGVADSIRMRLGGG